jgi:peptidyl-prolyl cis-trans isomerase SurA
MADVTSSARAFLSLPRGRAALAALTLATVAPLAACAGGPDLHPGDAAVVDGHAIRLSTVDDFAGDFCALEEPGLAQQGVVLPMALLRSAAVEALVSDALLPGFAKAVHIDLPAVRRGVRDEVRTMLAQGVPADLRSAAKRRFELESARRTVLQLAGRQGASSAEQASARGGQLFAAWRAKQDVTVDPRFGGFDLDSLKWDAANGSLSVPSDKAAGALDQKAAAALPADQRCGTPAS